MRRVTELKKVSASSLPRALENPAGRCNFLRFIEAGFAGWGGSFLMVYMLAGWVSDFICVCLETRWLGQKSWFLCARMTL